jgi:hypothetical protein
LHNSQNSLQDADCSAKFTLAQECPFCRAKITKSPIKSITLDGVIRKLVQNFAEDDKKAWSDRLAQRKDDPYNKLLEMITAAKQKKMKFLDIGTRWSANEQGTFFDGVRCDQKTFFSDFWKVFPTTSQFTNRSFLQPLRGQGPGIIHEYYWTYC